jgi:hypothetical protein
MLRRQKNGGKPRKRNAFGPKILSQILDGVERASMVVSTIEMGGFFQ